ncbi:nodulation protein NfeD [Pseudomonas sp. phDV1]|nr:nodulation protein NfeD [Pseudomonas sp. phDV1]
MLPGWLRLCLCALILCGSVGASAVPGAVVRLQVDGVIGPASADYLVRGLAKAVDEGAQLVLIEIDTPGGLDSSMRAIIKAILASPIPVASYVAPGGARAASAGTYILYASHVAAMAPGTNLGAATPVAIGMPGTPSKPPGKGEAGKDGAAEQSPTDAMTAKQVNDAAAYIRGLANMRGRNAEWAEQAVREAVSLSAEEALEQKVIDFLARDLSDLLRQLDGKTLQAAGVEVTLATAGAPLISHAPDWRTRLLAVITNPSVALILMMIGVYGLFFEFSNPGSGIGGVLGGISLILALYALQLLPVNYAGVALILLGIDVPGFGIPLALIVTLALTSAGLILAILGMALKARRRQQVAGDSGLVGSLVAVAAVQAEDPCQNRRWCRFCSEPRRVSARSSNRRSNAPWSALQW